MMVEPTCRPKAAGGEEGSVKDIGEEIAIFPNIKTLIANDCGMTTIDLSGLPNLEYVDLRQNPDLRTFDLANNKEIQVLFCDEGTDITGLDEAGLYFTDLLTSMQVSGKSATTTYQVEYDTHARPIAVTESYGTGGNSTTTTYSYDDQGRLVKTQAGDQSGWYDAYAYGENGLLSNAGTYWALDEGAKVKEYAYGYDGEGRLTQLARGSSPKGSDVKTFENAGAFVYHDGVLSAFKDTDRASIYSMGENGLLMSSCLEESSSQISSSCTYGASGALASFVSTYASLSGTASTSNYTTEYSDAGLPIQSTVPDDSSSMQVTYECNADGYINSIQWGGKFVYMAGSTGKLSYVKRVGSLEGREAERYVPVIRPSLNANSNSEIQGWSPLQDWFSTTALAPGISMLVLGPMDKVKEQLGLASTMLMNPNELKLFEYDREHWNDGLALGKEQPIDASGVAELLAKAAEMPLPVSADTFLDDSVYGEVVKQYLGAQKDANAGKESVFFNESSAYPLIPDSVKMLFGFMANWRSGSSSSSTDQTIDFSYADLNADGNKELVIAFPYMVSSTSSGNNKQNCVAVYGQADGKPALIASGAERLQCWVTPDGNVATYGGGALYGGYSLYKWDGSKSEQVELIDYSLSTSALDPNAENAPADLTVIGSDGKEHTSVSDMLTVNRLVNEFEAKNTHAQLNWTPIPVS